jgi:methyl-accepting chemotaxis protein
VVDRRALVGEAQVLLGEIEQGAEPRHLIAARRDLIAARRDLIAARRDLIAARRDLIAAWRDLIAAWRDLIAAWRDLVAAALGCFEARPRRVAPALTEPGVLGIGALGDVAQRLQHLAVRLRGGIGGDAGGRARRCAPIAVVLPRHRRDRQHRHREACSGDQRRTTSRPQRNVNPGHS